MEKKGNTYMRTDFDFPRWYSLEAKEEERELYERVYGFEELFADMMFRPGTPSGELIKVQSKANDDEEWEDDEMDLPEELTGCPYSYFEYKVTQLEEDECNGYFDQMNQILCISSDKLKDDATIIHEMIHLHESVVNSFPMYYHDTLLWSLYSDLRGKIPELDTIINEHAHILNEHSLYMSGGVHDILFLLKSFDLDIKKGYSLGTVFAYGRNKDFKKYKYNAKLMKPYEISNSFLRSVLERILILLGFRTEFRK